MSKAIDRAVLRAVARIVLTCPKLEKSKRKMSKKNRGKVSASQKDPVALRMSAKFQQEPEPARNPTKEPAHGKIRMKFSVLISRGMKNRGRGSALN